MVLGVSWRNKISSGILHGNLPKESGKVRSRRLELARQRIRHPELLASDLVIWEFEVHGEVKRDRPKHSYLSTLVREFGTKTKEELRILMRESDLWRKISAIYRTLFRLSSYHTNNLSVNMVIDRMIEILQLYSNLAYQNKINVTTLSVRLNIMNS